MSNSSKGRKISQFLADTVIPSDAEFTFISNGSNFKISASDFFAALGVTGTIVQKGDPLGTPVLNKAGSINEIRNIEDGPGIKSAVSAQGGIDLEHNFITDVIGVELVVDLTADQPKFRSLVAGTGINVSKSNGSIQIALSATPVSTKTVIVNSISDFPAAVAGVITLEDETQYSIVNDITTSNRFIAGDSVLSGADSTIITLAYTGVGIMFTSTNKNWKIKDLAVNCTSGTFIDFNGSGSEIFQILNSTINADILGTIDNFRGIHFDDTQINATTNGLLFGGTNGVILIEANLTSIDAGTLYDLGTATFSAYSATDCFITLNGTSVFLDGAASSANIDAGGLGTVHNCRFSGAGTPLQTITTSDDRWQFFINDEIPDTHQDSLLSLSGNATATTIAAVDTPTLIAGTWNLEHASYFTQTAAGRSTYTGDKEIHVSVTMSFSAAPVSGSNKIIGFYIAKNGTEIDNSEATNNLSSGNPSRTTVVWRISLVNGDYIEAFVENETDDIDVLVSDAVIRLD